MASCTRGSRGKLPACSRARCSCLPCRAALRQNSPRRGVPVTSVHGPDLHPPRLPHEKTAVLSRRHLSLSSRLRQVSGSAGREWRRRKIHGGTPAEVERQRLLHLLQGRGGKGGEGP